MKSTGYTMQERSFISLMRIWAVAFFLAAILFALAPDYLLSYINNVGSGIFGWHSPPTQLGTERFWLVLAVALLIGLSYLCLISQRNLIHNIGYARPVILTKFVSTAGFVIYLLRGDRQFFYLVGAIVDGLIFLITWRIYKRAFASRS